MFLISFLISGDMGVNVYLCLFFCLFVCLKSTYCIELSNKFQLEHKVQIVLLLPNLYTGGFLWSLYVCPVDQWFRIPYYKMYMTWNKHSFSTVISDSIMTTRLLVTCRSRESHNSNGIHAKEQEELPVCWLRYLPFFFFFFYCLWWNGHMRLLQGNQS